MYTVAPTVEMAVDRSPEAEIEFAYQAGFNCGFDHGLHFSPRDGKVDVDELWQFYKLLRFGTGRLDWRLDGKNSQEGA